MHDDAIFIKCDFCCRCYYCCCHSQLNVLFWSAALYFTQLKCDDFDCTRETKGRRMKNKIIENYFDIAMRNKFFLFFISSLELVDKSNKMQKLHEDILRHYFLLYSKSCCCCYAASFFRVHCLNDRSFASQPLVV